MWCYGVCSGPISWVTIASNHLSTGLDFVILLVKYCGSSLTPVLINAVPNPIIWMENIIKNIHKKVTFEKVPSTAYIECYDVYPLPYIGVKFSRLSIVSMV